MIEVVIRLASDATAADWWIAAGAWIGAFASLLLAVFAYFAYTGVQRQISDAATHHEEQLGELAKARRDSLRPAIVVGLAGDAMVWDERRVLGISFANIGAGPAVELDVEAILGEATMITDPVTDWPEKPHYAIQGWIGVAAGASQTIPLNRRDETREYLDLPDDFDMVAIRLGYRDLFEFEHPLETKRSYQFMTLEGGFARLEAQREAWRAWTPTFQPDETA